MLTKEEAYQFVEQWLAAWNAHDLDNQRLQPSAAGAIMGRRRKR